MIFKKAVEHTIWEETSGRADGAYTNDPADPGGETRWGISSRFNPHVNIANLSKSDAVAIYHTKYWLAQGCDKLQPGLALLYFDCSVNPGEGWARKALQRAANEQGAGLKVDGVIGPKTITAVQRCDQLDLIQELSADRAHYFATRPSFSRFGLGWMRRTMRTLTLASE